MKLYKEPFIRIKNGKKIIEVRLFDEKRQKIKLGDEIEFSLINEESEKILVKVIGLSIFDSFEHLYSSFDYKLFGHPEGTTLNNQLKDIRETYSEENEKKYGVLGLHIRLIN
jgi:ASC-1-like (ASCH) protein